MVSETKYTHNFVLVIAFNSWNKSTKAQISWVDVKLIWLWSFVIAAPKLPSTCQLFYHCFIRLLTTDSIVLFQKARNDGRMLNSRFPRWFIVCIYHCRVWFRCLCSQYGNSRTTSKVCNIILVWCPYFGKVVNTVLNDMS